jgi:iron complex outermembrane receptor protein
MIQDNNNIPGTQRIPFIPNFNSASAGAYGISKITLDQWVIDLGARYDYRYYSVSGFDYKNSPFSSELNFHNISATAGASLQLDKQQVWSVNVSSAWRPPHVAELYSLGTHQSAAAIEYGLLLNDSTNEVMDISEVNFENEQALKLVSSYQRTIGATQFDITGYANYIFNYIYLRAGGITETIRGVYPYFRYTQTDALFLGMDISANWQATKNIKANAKASLLRASDEKNDDYLVFIPSNRYEASIRFEEPHRFALKDFFVETKVKYVAEQHRAPRTITPREFQEALENDTDPFGDDYSNFDFMDAPDGYVLLNVSTGFSIKREKTRYDFRMAAENLLNTSYREYTNRFRYYADDLGRNFIVSLKCIF